MARPVKDNAEYFSHDNDMRNDVKVKAVRRKFGHEGYSVWNMLLEMLCNSGDFTLQYNDLSLELWAGDFEVEPEKLKEIIGYFIKLDLIANLEDRIFSENQIKRFSGLIDKRNKARERFLTQKQQLSGITASETTQSKVKEIKVKETKVNNIKEPVSPEGESHSKGLHQKMISVYDDFIIKKTSVPAKMNGAEGKAMKEIIAYMKNASKDKTDEGVLNSWAHLLGSWDKLESFYQGKLKLMEINSNMVNLINQIKNGKGNNKVGSTEKFAKYFAGKTEGN